MCELLGLSSQQPLKVGAMMAAFQRRGGDTADNPDGWGIASFGDNRFALYREPEAAAHSRSFAALTRTIETRLLIAHVRKARMPPVNTLSNTHPFLHRCCGKEWAFAHNGLVPDLGGAWPQSAPCIPQGETDSEHAFCRLLAEIAPYFGDPHTGAIKPWFEVLRAAAVLIAAHGKFNFLISDGSYLIAYGHDRLHYQEHASGAAVAHAWIATEPLLGGKWRPFDPGELRVYRDGHLVGCERAAVAEMIREVS